MRAPVIAVIGGRKASRALLGEAEKAGALIARKGATLICGGLGGIMEAASRGAQEEGGLTIGILPHDIGSPANPFIDVAIATGMGIGRNIIIARTADALIAIGGAYGTLSEIAFALQLEKPVIGIKTWEIKGIDQAADAEEAVQKAFKAIGQPA